MPKHVSLEDQRTGFDEGQTIGNTVVFDLEDLRRVLRVRRAVIIGTTLAFLAAVTFVVLLVTPLYTATAVVILDQRKNNFEDVSAVISGIPSDQVSVQNEMAILASPALAGRVIDKLKLGADPEFNSPYRPLSFLSHMLDALDFFGTSVTTLTAEQRAELERSDLIKRFSDHLSVLGVGASTAITVSFESEDPGKAKKIANAIVEAYLQDQVSAKSAATQRATQWLLGRVVELSRKAKEADSAAQRYKAEHNITTTANGSSVVEQQTVAINDQLIIAKGDLDAKQASYGSLAELARAGRASNSGLVLASPLISALRAQETELARQLADLSSRYLPTHPKILNLQAQRANVEAKIAEEVQRIVDAARNDVSVASARVGSLQASLARLETEDAGQSQNLVQLTALEAEATSTRSMYEAFLTRLSQTESQDGIQTPDVRVISWADLPSYPSFPKRTLAIGISIPAGIIFGLMLAFLLERLDSGFRTTAQVERYLSLPVLATVPEVRRIHRKRGASAADLIVNKPMSSFTDSVRGLELALTNSDADQPVKVILVTSSGPGEGKTTLAVSLARIAAASGLKTVVVDCDLREPNLGKATGCEMAERGLVEALADPSILDKCYSKDAKSEALVLPCRKRPLDPADLLNSQAMEQLTGTLRRDFDLVIIDSAPMLPINDSKILSRYADAVVLAIRWEKTPREAVVDALRALSDVHAPVAGIAMTRADVKRLRYYSHGKQNYRKYKSYFVE